MTTDDRHTRARLLAVALLAGAFLLLTLPTILLARDVRTHRETGPQYRVSEAGDQEKFHLPVIRTMAEQWPRVDVVGYDSATSPGYHLLMAAVARAVGERVLPLQLLNAAIGLALLLAVAHWCAALGGARWAVIACAPLLCSAYFVTGSIWLTTDNLALLFVVCALGVCVFAPCGPGRALGAGALATLAVGARQIHVWVAAPIGLAALLGAGLFRKFIPWLLPGALFPRDVAREPRTEGAKRAAFVVACVSAAAPLALLACFAWLWGGLTPPRYRDLHASGPNFAQPALALGLLGVFALFYVPGALLRAGRVRPTDWAPWLGAAAGVVCAALARTSHSPADGRRYGWLWEAVRLAPDVAERSVLLLALAPLGGLMMGLLWRCAQRAGRAREASLLVFASVAWCAAQTANTQAWQRYSEPFLLVVVAWLAGLSFPARSADARIARTRLGAMAESAPLALAAGLLAVTVKSALWPALAG